MEAVFLGFEIGKAKATLSNETTFRKYVEDIFNALGNNNNINNTIISNSTNKNTNNFKESKLNGTMTIAPSENMTVSNQLKQPPSQ